MQKEEILEIKELRWKLNVQRPDPCFPILKEPKGFNYNITKFLSGVLSRALKVKFNYGWMQITICKTTFEWKVCASLCFKKANLCNYAAFWSVKCFNFALNNFCLF